MFRKIFNKKRLLYFANSKKRLKFALEKRNGTLTEWLGSGLQNRVQQFESAGYLRKARIVITILAFCFRHNKLSLPNYYKQKRQPLSNIQ